MAPRHERRGVIRSTLLRGGRLFPFPFLRLRIVRPWHAPCSMTSCDQPSLALLDGQHAEQAARIAFANRQQESSDMKRIALSCAAGAFALVCASAFAQTNPPSSATGLEAG